MTGVRYISLAENSGYGVAARDYVRALVRAGLEVEWSPLVSVPQGYAPWTAVDGAAEWIAGLLDGWSNGGACGRELERALGREVEPDAVILHCTPEHWPHHLVPGRRNIGSTVWETDAPPPRWAELMNLVDRVLVPSDFSREVFRNAGVDRPIDVIPHIRRPDAPPPPAARVDELRERLGIPRGHLVFYTIEAWTARKTPWRSIAAYLAAFTAPDPVAMVVKTGVAGPRSAAAVVNTPTRQLVEELSSSSADPPRVVLLDRELPTSQIDLLHRLGDCYLSLTHGEGWGLSPFDAAAAGNPVVITGWGGQLSYLGRDWPYLVDFELTPVMDAQGRGSYLPTQRWASPVANHAVELLREVQRWPEAARERGRRLADRIRTEFSEEAIGRRLVEVIRAAV